MVLKLSTAKTFENKCISLHFDNLDWFTLTFAVTLDILLDRLVDYAVNMRQGKARFGCKYLILIIFYKTFLMFDYQHT